jgi:ribosome-binding factor A
MEIAKRLGNMRKIPELLFFIDDSLDYAEEINNLLKK